LTLLESRHILVDNVRFCSLPQVVQISTGYRVDHIMGFRVALQRFVILLPLAGLMLPLQVSAQKWNRYGPGTRSQASAIYDASTDQMIMFGGQHAPTSIDFNDTWAVKNVIATSSATAVNLNWVKVNVSGTLPSLRFGHSAVYNASSNRMIVFGGGTGFPGPCVNDLWVLKNPNGVGGNPTWTKLSPTGTLPPVREGHTAVYNATANTMTVFGGTDCAGNYYSDVWVLTNADGASGTPAWSQLTPSGGPSERAQSSAIYDSKNNVMTIFGGVSTGKTVYNDVWTLSHANGTGGTPVWAQFRPSGTAPTARSGQSAIYDATNNRMVIHGGVNSAGASRNDTWILTNANGIGGTPAWSQLTPAVAGPYRASHTAIYDAASNEMVIFGGDSQLAKTFTDDHVMVLSAANGMTSGAAWTQYGPAPRYHSAAVYDSVTDQMIVFGGEGASGPLNDVWSEQQIVSDGQGAQPTAQWVQVFPTKTAPVARFGHSGIYDSTSNRMIVFGGGVNNTACLNDVWALDDANSSLGAPTWLPITASGTAPGARMNHSAVYDSAVNVMLIYGGANCAGHYISDVWTLSNANGEGGTPTWTKVVPSGTAPAPRENASAVYDSVNNVLTIYAGDAGANGFADVWTLSNANGHGGTPRWTQLAPTGTAPSARTGQSAVYDSVNNRMIIFGGINSVTGTGYLGDAWILTSPNGIGGTPSWIAEKVTGTAPLRRYHSAFYSSSFNDMIVFGGESQIAQSPADDHVFILSSANGLN
jgi:hypothetical protein